MKQVFAKKSNSAFKQIIFIIMAVSGLLLFLSFKIYQIVYLYAGVLIYKIKTACGCAQIDQLAAMHPFISGSLIVLSLIALAFVSFAVYKLFELMIRTRKFTAYYLNNLELRPSSKLRKAISSLNLDENMIVEAREAMPAVFCFGFWKPKICVSRGLIRILDEEELKAVLSHEHHHLIAREPMKLFIVRYFQSVFFFVPGIKAYIGKYLVFSELAADEKAMGGSADQSKLAGALLKMSETEEGRLLRQGLPLSFFNSVMAERVNKLADNSYMPKFKLWGKSFLFGFCSAALAILTVFVFLSDSAKAIEMHRGSHCSLNDPAGSGAELVCKQNGDQPVCAKNDNHQSVIDCSWH